MPRNKLQPCFTSLTETSLHKPFTDHKIVHAPLGTSCERTVRSTVGSTVSTLEVKVWTLFLSHTVNVYVCACTYMCVAYTFLSGSSLTA